MSAEIKVTSDFSEQLAELKSLAEMLKTDWKLENIDATPITRELATRYKRMNDILKVYKTLLVHDVNELERFCSDIKDLDNSLS